MSPRFRDFLAGACFVLAAWAFDERAYLRSVAALTVSAWLAKRSET